MRLSIAILTAVSMLLVSGASASSKRSQTAIVEFKKAQPCPATRASEGRSGEVAAGTDGTHSERS